MIVPFNSLAQATKMLSNSLMTSSQSPQTRWWFRLIVSNSRSQTLSLIQETILTLRTCQSQILKIKQEQVRRSLSRFSLSTVIFQTLVTHLKFCRTRKSWWLRRTRCSCLLIRDSHHSARVSVSWYRHRQKSRVSLVTTRSKVLRSLRVIHMAWSLTDQVLCRPMGRKRVNTTFTIWMMGQPYKKTHQGTSHQLFRKEQVNKRRVRMSWEI
jgi:hypothetical protein